MMAYVDGLVIAVPTASKSAYLEMVRKSLPA